MPRKEVTLEIDVPPDTEVVECRRVDDGYGLHVRYEAPSASRCDRCGQEEATNVQVKNTFYTTRDVDLVGKMSFLVYQPLMHRCSSCGHRQHLIPPFKRKDTSYTFGFEDEVLRRLRRSTAEQVAGDLGVDAETVERIAEQRIADARAKQVDAKRVIVDVGIDEISLRKGHRLYATLLWDLSDPAHPELLAAAKGRDEAAVQACLERLSGTQRAGVRTLRSDMGAAMLTAKKWLPNAQSVIDRFHVAKRVGEVADGLRKKNHPALQARLE